MSNIEVKFERQGVRYALVVQEKNGYAGSYSMNSIRSFAETMVNRIVKFGESPEEALRSAENIRGMRYLDGVVREIMPAFNDPASAFRIEPERRVTAPTPKTKRPPRVKPKPKASPPRPASSVNNRFPNTPQPFRQAISDVQNDPTMNDVLKLFETRASEFRSEQAMCLAAAYLNPLAREYVDKALDQFWRTQASEFKYGENDARQVVVGGGLHAAIYCAIAHAKTGVKPLVIDSGKRVGGAFAVTRNPSFYLNSRNRPGPLALPGMEMQGSLNYIPGAPVQPADLSGDEYADNATLGWAIRMSLALHADVLSGVRVEDIGNQGVYTDKGYVRASRVVVATGLGVPARFRVQESERVMNYWDFMRRMDTPFPMQGMGRVAVLGAGDGGKTVIENLIGQGPARATVGVASLDWVREIDWYGVEQRTCVDWEANNRSRYKGIGRSFPREVLRNISTEAIRYPTARIRPRNTAANDVTVGFNEVMVDGRPYDNVVIATGFDLKQRITPLDEQALTNSSIEQIGGMQVGRRIINGGLPTYLVGPTAQLAVTSQETTAVGTAIEIPENTTSIFRYARKTAALADSIN